MITEKTIRRWDYIRSIAYIVALIAAFLLFLFGAIRTYSQIEHQVYVNKVQIHRVKLRVIGTMDGVEKQVGMLRVNMVKMQSDLSHIQRILKKNQ